MLFGLPCLCITAARISAGGAQERSEQKPGIFRAGAHLPSLFCLLQDGKEALDKIMGYKKQPLEEAVQKLNDL